MSQCSGVTSHNFPYPTQWNLLVINDKWNFEKHIAKICRKVSKKITVFKKNSETVTFLD